AGLDDVEIEPVFAVKPERRGVVSSFRGAGAVIGDKMDALAARLEAAGHGDPDILLVGGDRVAAQVPDHGIALVAIAHELAKGERILRVEDRLADGPLPLPNVVALGDH